MVPVMTVEETGEPPEEFKEIQVVEKIREDFDWESYLDEYNTATPVLVETDPNREWPSYDHRLTLPDYAAGTSGLAAALSRV